MSESAFAPLRVNQFLYQYKLCLLHAANYYLGNPVTMVYYLWLRTQVNQQNFYLTPVITIYGPWRIQTGYALFEGKSATGPYLCFVTGWQLNKQTGGYQHSFQGI